MARVAGVNGWHYCKPLEWREFGLWRSLNHTGWTAIGFWTLARLDPLDRRFLALTPSGVLGSIGLVDLLTLDAC